MTRRFSPLAALQRLDRLFDAVEEVVAPDQGLEALASEALLGAHRFEPREGDVDAPGAQPRDECGEHRRAGVVDLAHRVGLDHQQPHVRPPNAWISAWMP